MVDDITTFTILTSKTGYVVEDVPCLKCPFCESVVFTQEVAEKLEIYTTGKVLPMSTYRAWVFKWGQTINAIPSISSSKSQDIKISLKNADTGGQNITIKI
jgi:hypothetical protein